MHAFDADLERTSQSMRRLLRGFTLLCSGLIFGVGGWAFSAEIESAVLATGKFVVKSNLQAVQHVEGGKIGAILVGEGAQVRKDQVVIRLDSSQIKADLAIIEDRLIDLTAERARLAAERDGRSTLEPPAPPFELRAKRTAFNSAILLQSTLLSARHSGNRSQISQLKERKRQTKVQISGLENLRRARVIEFEQASTDLDVQRKLDAKRLIRKSVLRQTIREFARVRGDIGDIDAKIAEARSRLAETEFRITEHLRTKRSEILDKLKLNQSQLAEAREKYVAAHSRMQNLEIRAPRSGLVHELQVFTVGGVIKPGQTVMSIIPQDDLLLVSAKIATHEIDQVHIGQEATVRISAFKQRITPELSGTVVNLAPDETTDERTGQSFFSVKIEIRPEERSKLNGKKLTPGLPADVMIQGQKRRVISYLTQPLLDQMALAFKEE